VRAMSWNPVSGREALEKAYEAASHLRGWRQDPRRGLAIILPYGDCVDFIDAPPLASRIVRSLVCAVIADCYREMGEVVTAAEWYRRASESRKRGGYPSLYADMVISHKLADHYENALDCLKESKANWKAKPLLVRFYWHVVSMWWIYPSAWKFRFREGNLIPQLESLVRAGKEGG
jgi:hypothetical protein